MGKNVTAANHSVVNATATKTVPVKAATTAKATPTPTPTATPQVYGSTDIGNHLVDIAFGPDNNVIQKLAGTAVPVTVSGSYTTNDVAQLNAAINQFNLNSATTQLADNITFNSGTAGIQFVYLSGAQLNQLPVDNTTISYKDPTGNYYFLQIGQTAISSKNGMKTFINADMTGAERAHWTLRAFLLNLGFFGQTAKYPDSLFYAAPNNTTQLSAIDLDALQLMYGKKITNGMTKSTVRSII
jgi:hypothetical protein